MTAVLAALGTMAAIAVIGWLLSRFGVLGEHAELVLAKVVFSIATPSLLMVTIPGADLHLLLTRTALTTALTTTVVAAVAVLVLRLVLHRSAADSTVGALSASYLNAGNLGLPLAVYLLGDAVAVVPTMLFQLLILAPVAFTVLDSRGGEGGSRWTPVTRPLRNPIIVSALLGIVLALLPWSLPEVVFEPFRLIGAAAAPLALITLGMSLAGARAASSRAPLPDLALVVVLRAVVHPALAILIGQAVGLHGEALLAVVVMASLPTAQNVLVYAVQYGHGQAIARDAQLATTALCLPVMIVVTAWLL